MKQILKETIEKYDRGLFVCELPTGSGKTYNTIQTIAEYVKANETNPKRKQIVFITPLLKNLKIHDFKKAFATVFNDDNAFEKHVLLIPSLIDPIIEHICDKNINVHKDVASTEAYHDLQQAILMYKEIDDKHGAANRFKESTRELERKFRQVVINFWDKKAKELQLSPENTMTAIEQKKDLSWIGQFYPSVYTDKYDVLLMSAKKFVMSNSPIIKSSYDFISDEFLSNKIVFIDEFDSVKDVFTETIIEKATADRADYLELFSQIKAFLHRENFSSEFVQALSNEKIGDPNFDKIHDTNKWYFKNGLFRKVEKTPPFVTFDELAATAQKIEQTYFTNLSYRVKDENVDKKQYAIIKDNVFHTAFGSSSNKWIDAEKVNDQIVQIAFVTPQEYKKHEKEKTRVNIFSMLRAVNRFFRLFNAFAVTHWAKNYKAIINTQRYFARKEGTSHYPLMTIENALSTFGKKLRLSPLQQKILFNNCDAFYNNRKNDDDILSEFIFYNRGFELYDFIDSEDANDETTIRFYAIRDTAEKLLSYAANRCLVFGLSATAEYNEIFGNFNIDFLKQDLGSLYHVLTDVQKGRVRKKLTELWKGYEGRVTVNLEQVELDETKDLYELCEQILSNKLNIVEAVKIIEGTTTEEYYKKEYIKMLQVMKRFWEHEDIQYLLFFSMRLPGSSKSHMEEKTIKALLNLAYKDKFGVDNTGQPLIVLKGIGYEQSKAILEQRLKKGEKLFVITSYKTMAQGQNADFEIDHKDFEKYICLNPHDKNDNRMFKKDADAIYLSDITHVVPDITDTEKALRALINIEEAENNCEICSTVAKELKKQAMQAEYNKDSRTGLKRRLNTIYSINLHKTKQVVQAVGRLDRGFLKNKNIYLLIDSKLLDSLVPQELDRHILPPEIKKIREAIEHKADTQDHESSLNSIAEQTSNYAQYYHTKQLATFFKGNATEKNMSEWKQLRELVLKYPTASIEEMKKEKFIRAFYITAGTPKNNYIYSYAGANQPIIIDFSNDYNRFKRNEHVHKDTESGTPLIFTMSEEKSRLPLILKVHGMREFFKKHNYALSFEKKDYMMSPVLFNDIYKGALGEVAGKYIIKHALGFELDDITDPLKFERFDYIFHGKHNVCFDFKNWQSGEFEDPETVVMNSAKKLEEMRNPETSDRCMIGFLINIVNDGKRLSISEHHTTPNGYIIEIPRLIDENGNFDNKSMKKIMEWIKNADKM